MAGDNSLDTEKQKENTNPATSKAKAADAPCPPENQECLEEKKKQRTWGNVIFDWGVYASIAWAGVSAFSLATAHLAMNSKHAGLAPLRDFYQGMKNGVAGFLKSTLMKYKGAAHDVAAKLEHDKRVNKWASGTALYYILGAGGSILMWPIKYLEDNRLKLAAKIDNALGTTPPDPELVKKEPKQTWGSVFAGRALSVIGIGYGSFVLMGPDRASKISKWVGKHATKGWMHISPQSKLRPVHKIMNTAVFDVLFTVITASVTYAFSRFVARSHDRKLEAEDALLAVNPVAPNLLADQNYYESLPKREHAHQVQRKEKPAKRAESFTQRAAEETNHQPSVGA